MRSVSGVRGGAGDAVHSVRVGRTILFVQEGKSSFVLSANLRKRAQEFEENPELVRGIVAEGADKARDAARQTLDEVRRAMHLRAE